MAKKPDESTKVTGLRRQAEELLRTTKRDVAAMPVKDVQQLVHELQVHQIELEIQNDELRRTQMELEVARDRYVYLYDFSPAGHLSLDTHGMIVEANLRAGTLLGINRKELIGQSLASFVAPDDQDIFHRHYKNVLRTGTRQACEVHLRKKAGACCCVYLESLACSEEAWCSIHWRTALLDTSDRKRVEQELANQQAQLEGIIASAMDAIITVDEGERVVVFNRAAESMFLCQAADVIGQPFDRFIPEQFRQAHHGHVRGFALKQMTSRSMGQPGELMGLRANGEEFPVEAAISHILVGGKKLLTVILRDVTERKRAEQEQAQLIKDLTRSQHHFQALFNWTPSAVGISTVAEGRFFDVNEGFTRLTGYTREEVIGRTTLELGLWADPSERAIVLREIQAQGRLHNREGLLRTKSGEIRSIMVSVDSIQLGSTPCLIYLGHDITERKRAEEALRESESRFRIMADTAPVLIWISGLDKLCTYFNQGWLDYTGRMMEQELGNGWTDGVHPEDFDRCRKTYGEAFDRREPFQMEYRLRKRDGQYGWLLDKGVPRRFPSGEFAGYIGACTDITWRKMVEEALQASDVFTQSVLNSLSAHVCVLDREGVILKTNDAWKGFAPCHSDYTVAGIDVGQNYLEVCRRAIADGESTAQITLEGVESVLAGSRPSFTQEYPCHSPEEERWFLMRVTPLKDAKGVVISHTDISGQVRMGLALEQRTLLLGEKQKELEVLAVKLIEAQEEERKRIARELHDDFNQRLAALSVELESLERAPIASPALARRRLSAIRVQAGKLSDDLHDLAYRLHPSLLEHVGLEVAARDHVVEFAKRSGLSVRFIARKVPKTLSPEIATNLFRVMQESLHNVSKHAQATDVTVRLSGSSKGIGLSVRDNGKGFDLEGKNAPAKGLGLVSMQERARGLGGFFRIHSLPRAGTKACAWIPHFQKGR